MTRRRPQVVTLKRRGPAKAQDAARLAAEAAYADAVLKPVLDDLARPDSALSLVGVAKAIVRRLSAALVEKIGPVDTASILIGIAAPLCPTFDASALKALRRAKAEAALAKEAA